jgi:manganese/zinc/iron transport system permease protein
VATSEGIADRSVSWPTAAQWQRVLSLHDYNTRVVVLGTTVLGSAAGLVGSFTLLRRRALMGDAISHATLPGICLAFMLATAWGFDGKSLPILLFGATLSGLLGVGAILFLRHFTRLKEDASLGAVLSVFFGGGVALLGISQQMREGHAAGLESFVYGKAASLSADDVRLIVSAALACIVVAGLLFKELKLLCFDPTYAAAVGLPTLALDVTLMALVVFVCLVGLQAVGLILIIAALVIPAASARFWTEHMGWMTALSAAIGGVSGWLGATVSALFSHLPSGAMIVLACTACFFISLLFGSARGVLRQWTQRWALDRSIERQHLLRTMYELLEPAEASVQAIATDRREVTFQQLLRERSWSPATLRKTLRRAVNEGLVFAAGDDIRFTSNGLQEAARLTRQHRLWELYLITHADIAPANVDRGADAIEHVLEPSTVAELEALLERQSATVPASPHAIIHERRQLPESASEVGRLKP